MASLPTRFVLSSLLLLPQSGLFRYMERQMGLGKTVQTCAFLSYLFHDLSQYGPFLIVVPLSTLPAWQMQLGQWSPDLNVIAYTGNGPSRAIIREHEFGQGKKIKFNVLLTTYEFALKDRSQLGAIKWQYLAVDEVRFFTPCHDGLVLVNLMRSSGGIGSSTQEFGIATLRSAEELPGGGEAPYYWYTVAE